MEKLSSQTISIMSKEELQEALQAVQLKLEVAESELEQIKADAQLGKKYLEHLKAEAKRVVNLVHKESPVLKLLDTADADTLKQIIDEFSQKAQRAYKPSAQSAISDEPKELTKEKLQKMSYSELISVPSILKEVQ